MNYAERLKALRLECGMTQPELAKKSNLATSCIAMIELGRREPSANTLICLSQALEVSADYLLGLEDDFGVRVDDKEKNPDTLSAEERRLVEGYREINAAGKKLVMQTVETLRGTSAGSGSTSTQNKIG